MTRGGPLVILLGEVYAENVLAFANNIHTVDGGTHVTGFRAALTSSLNDWARRAGVETEDVLRFEAAQVVPPDEQFAIYMRALGYDT